MNVFGGSGTGVKVWGPTASTTVTVSALNSLADSSWILTGISIGAKEIVDVRQCFNDISFLYALGNDQGQCRMSMSFLVFFGKENCNGEGGMSSIESGIKAYSSARISNHKAGVQSMSVGGAGFKGWLTGLDIGAFDPEKGVCVGTLSFIMKLG